MDTPIGQFVLIGNFRRRLARELLVYGRFTHFMLRSSLLYASVMYVELSTLFVCTFFGPLEIVCWISCGFPEHAQFQGVFFNLKHYPNISKQILRVSKSF